jgi:Big-like domain-containing protein/dockerin type I repeat protein
MRRFPLLEVEGRQEGVGMIGRKLCRFSVGIAMLVALPGVVNAQGTCSGGAGTVTCTGGAGSQVIDTNNDSNSAQPTIPAQSNFPSTINVTGGGAAVKTVSITLHGYTSVFDTTGTNNFLGSFEMGLMLVSPSNHNLEVLRAVGNPNVGENDITVTLADGNTLAPDGNTFNGTWTSGTYSPASYTAEEPEPNYTQAGAPALQHAAGTGTDSNLNGHSTFNSVNGVFTGDTINGNWKLYLVSDALLETNVKFTSWDITITYTAASESSTTTLSSSATTAFTSSPGNSVTLTATVTGSGTPTGTVTFMNGSNTLSCSGGNQTLSSNQATCITSFTTEGLQSLSATYSGDSTFVGSSGTDGVFTYNHATNPTGTTYCNSGTITDGSGLVDVKPYPSVIFVGDGTSNSPSISSNSVDTVSLTLKNFQSNDANGLHMLLVSPDGSHTLDFWGEAGGGAASLGNYNLQDGSVAVPNSAISPGTYSATDNFTTDNFTLGTPIPAPAPQPPATFSKAEPAGTSTFESSFVGATANGTWLLYVDDEGTTQSPTSTTANMAGWCINISPASGAGTSTTLVSSPTEFATKGSLVTFTATVTSNTSVNEGTVTFTENGTPLVGAPNSGVASVSAGVASISTSSLPEGDHKITATYHDASATFNDSIGTENMRVDAATPTPTLSGTTWTYCNTAGITIPAGTVFTNDVGPAAPNPSNIFVTNLAGTINTVTLTLKNLSVEFPGDLESLLVGPNGNSVPGTAQTLDFFSPNDGVNLNPISNQTLAIADVFAPVPANAGSGTSVGTQIGPTSNGPTSYTASLFYTLPGTFNHATNQGNFDFNGAVHGVYTDANPNGTWSLYFDQTTHHTGDSAGSWCMNFTENAPAVSVVKSHTGPNPGNHFAQGGTGSFSIVITNNGPGPTGDPDGNHPMTVQDTLASDFTVGTLPTGTPWNCGAVGQTVTCTSHNAVADGSSYPTLTIPVSVSASAATSDTNTASAGGAGVNSTNSNTDTVTIDAAPVLAISKSPNGTFTQGQTGTWDITVSNTAANGSTSGTTTVVDTLPSGYTLTNFGGTGWGCSGTTTVTCSSNQQVAGGSSFNPLVLSVLVPAASPTSVTNNAVAFGGGDLTHTNSGNGATTFSTVTVAQVPAKIVINGTQTQSTGINTAFGSLAVTVEDAGNVAIKNYSPVVFTATTGSNGQSGIFGNTTGTTSISANGSGIADPGTFTANGKVGSYSVGVVAGGVTNSFTLTNTGTAATVTNVTSTTANGSYTVGAMINVSVTFSKAVNVTGTPLLALNSGGTASYVSGTGTATLSFLYTVGAGQNSTHLDATSSSALTLNGGTIIDGSGTAAILTLPAPGAAGSLGANTNIVIDTTSPTVVSYSVDFGIETYNLIGASRTTHLPWSMTGITVVFSKPIASATTASLSGISATGLSGLGTNTLTWTFGAITNATLSTVLAGSGANAIKDTAGNGLAGGTGFSQAFSVLYGDFTGDGAVTAADLLGVTAATKQAYNLFADINGDGVVNTADATIVKVQEGATQH